MPSPDSAEIIKVSSNFRRSLAAFASASSFSRGTRSILLITRILGCATLASVVRMVSASLSMPSLASSSTQTRSASCAPVHAVSTMARSSRRFGAKMPGVSTSTSCALFSTRMPRISARVVCTLRETIVTLAPTSAFTSVDLPTLGAPISATKPQRVAAGTPSLLTSGFIFAANFLALDHRERRAFFRRALVGAGALRRLQPRQGHRDTEHRIVLRPGAIDLAIDRRRQAFRLRPFLQARLGIAQRPAMFAHPLGPVPFDEFCRRLIAAVEIDRPDHGLADIAEHGPAQARVGHRVADRT